MHSKFPCWKSDLICKIKSKLPAALSVGFGFGAILAKKRGFGKDIGFGDEDRKLYWQPRSVT